MELNIESVCRLQVEVQIIIMFCAELLKEIQRLHVATKFPVVRYSQSYNLIGVASMIGECDCRHTVYVGMIGKGSRRRELSFLEIFRSSRLSESVSGAF